MGRPGPPRPVRASCVPAAPWNRAPRGVTAVLVAICLVMLCVFLALALNVGHLFSVKGELQNAADSAALAGAQDLDGTMEPITSTVSLVGAIASGTDFGERHATDTGTDVEINAGDVQIGFWDIQARSFTKFEVSSVTPEMASCRTASATQPCINAVRASSYRDTDHSSSVPIAFGALLGKLTSNVGAEAVAVTGGPCGMNCIGLPIVLPDCGVDKFLVPNCTGGEYKVMFNSANTDTAGWADLGAGNDTVKCLLEQSQSSSTLTCSDYTSCKVTETLTVIEPLNEVTAINGVAKSACDLVTDLYNNPLTRDKTYVVPIVDAECPAPGTTQEQWNRQWTILKFATVQISRAPSDCGGTDKFFWVKVLCDQVTDNASSGGCAAAGTWVRPGLVK